MAYVATVIPVMIASPGDVIEEREIARAVIHDWNDVNSQHSQIVLSAVGWDSHSSPELGERPQELINKRVLQDCDLLVAIFWTRIGTPTGKAQSGTVEEIEEHVSSGKPAMIYFSAKPVSLPTVELTQYSDLKAVQAEWSRRGLVETYDTSEQFRHKFTKQLQLCLRKNEYLTDLVGANSQVDERTERLEGRGPKLSADARELLKAAGGDTHGMIMKREFLNGQQINAGERVFGNDSRREFSRWVAAIDELVNCGLITARGYKGDLFELTHEGWLLAEK